MSESIFYRLHVQPSKVQDRIEQDMILSLAEYRCNNELPPEHKACGRGVVCVACQRYALNVAEGGF